MMIDNESWSLAKLFEIFEKKDSIAKPKFQRDKKWTLQPQPEKKNIPNYKDYINFLITNKNSVFPISLGTEFKDGKQTYIVIDGNNRLNSIITFLKNPYLIFPEYYNDLFNFINTSDIDTNIKTQIINTIKELNYRDISNFKRLKLILPSLNIESALFCEIEEKIYDTQKKFLYNDNTNFDKIINLNINIFKDGTYENYSKIFEDINKHSNILSENELLSAILFTTSIKLNNNDLKNKILVKITKFYDEKGKGEELVQYKFEVKDYETKDINAFDFMIGFQNYCNELYPVIHKFDSSGLSVFFKIFKLLYGSISCPKFTETNIVDFIDKMYFACDILNKACLRIFPKNIDGIFNSSCVKINENTFIKKIKWLYYYILS